MYKGFNLLVLFLIGAPNFVFADCGSVPPSITGNLTIKSISPVLWPCDGTRKLPVSGCILTLKEPGASQKEHDAFTSGEELCASQVGKKFEMVLAHECCDAGLGGVCREYKGDSLNLNNDLLTACYVTKALYVSRYKSKRTGKAIFQYVLDKGFRETELKAIKVVPYAKVPFKKQIMK